MTLRIRNDRRTSWGIGTFLGLIVVLRVAFLSTYRLETMELLSAISFENEVVGYQSRNSTAQVPSARTINSSSGILITNVSPLASPSPGEEPQKMDPTDAFSTSDGALPNVLLSMPLDASNTTASSKRSSVDIQDSPLINTTSSIYVENYHVTGVASLPPNVPGNASWRPTRQWIDECCSEYDIGGRKAHLVIPFPEGWPHYSLGDCIKICQQCSTKRCKKHPESIKCRIWAAKNDTFASYYYKHHCERKKKHQISFGGNLTLVDAMLAELGTDRAFAMPAIDEVVIHLRLGDVIERSDERVGGMLEYGGNPIHGAAFKDGIKSISEYLDTLESTGLNKIRIRGGSHMPDFFQKSRVYAGCLETAMQYAGYDVTMLLNGATPDEDFYYAATAQHFIAAVGGYSRLMRLMVQRHGGSVYGRVF